MSRSFRLLPAPAGVEGNVPRLAVLRFLCWMHLMSAVIIPFFREWGRLSFVQIFALQTWFMLMSFLMEVPSGAVADRFGRKVSVALVGFLVATASLLYGTFPHLVVFVAAETLFAVAIALISGADEALAYDSLLACGREAEASRVMSRLEAAKLAGILAGALVGAVVAARLGVRWPMLLQSVPMALSGTIATEHGIEAGLEIRVYDRRRKPVGLARVETAAPTDAVAVVITGQGSRPGFFISKET